MILLANTTPSKQSLIIYSYVMWRAAVFSIYVVVVQVVAKLDTQRVAQHQSKLRAVAGMYRMSNNRLIQNILRNLSLRSLYFTINRVCNDKIVSVPVVSF